MEQQPTNTRGLLMMMMVTMMIIPTMDFQTLLGFHRISRCPTFRGTKGDAHVVVVMIVRGA